MDLAISELTTRLRRFSKEQLAQLAPDELAEIERVLTAAAHEKDDARCASLNVSFDEGALYWLTTLTRTENPQAKEKGLEFRSPFPKKQYFIPLFSEMSKWSRLFIPKSRDMMVSWSVMGFSTHRAQWHNEETIVQTASEKKACELVDYVMQLYRNQPEWLRFRHPLQSASQMEAVWKDGGRVMAIPAGEDKIRMWHPTRYVMDEAAFLPEAQNCYEAANPVCPQIIAISTAAPGWFADQCAR